MTKLANMFLACLIAGMFFAAPLAASAKWKEKPNSGYCKSGMKAGNIKKCKENGGTR